MRRAIRLTFVAALAALLAGAGPAAAGQPVDADAVAVRQAVQRFLAELGQRRLNALPALFAPKATMVTVRLRDGAWTSSHQTFEEWLAGLKAQTPGTVFEEPLTNVTVHVESGHLAFLRADFTVVVGGQVRSHGVDYFTLVKQDGAWKIVNGAYTSIQGAP